MALVCKRCGAAREGEAIRCALCGGAEWIDASLRGISPAQAPASGFGGTKPRPPEPFVFSYSGIAKTSVLLAAVGEEVVRVYLVDSRLAWGVIGATLAGGLMGSFVGNAAEAELVAQMAANVEQRLLADAEAYTHTLPLLAEAPLPTVRFVRRWFGRYELWAGRRRLLAGSPVSARGRDCRYPTPAQAIGGLRDILHSRGAEVRV